MEEKTYWGYHLRLEGVGSPLELITSRENIYNFTKRLVKDIDMVAYGEPQIIKFGSGDKEGITLIQLIETSNITCHFVDYNGSSFWDVFSCKPFDQQIVVDLIREYFKPKAIQSDFKTREAPSCP